MESRELEPADAQERRPLDAPSGEWFPADYTVIEVRLRELNQLFDSLDPSPFREKDLDAKAEDYIVDSFKELPARERCAVVFYVEQRAGHSDEGRVVGEAIRIHFGRRAQLKRRQLRWLIRRGWISLAVGLCFLVVVFVIGRIISRLLGEGLVMLLSRESLLIVGWVAMWRPLEIFLYDWWPILGEQRLYERLSRLDVRLVDQGRAATGPYRSSGAK
jgi:hypothetical protein